MKKRILAISICVVMAIATGCSGGGKSKNNNAERGTTAKTGASEEVGESENTNMEETTEDEIVEVVDIYDESLYVEDKDAESDEPNMIANGETDDGYTYMIYSIGSKVYVRVQKFNGTVPTNLVAPAEIDGYTTTYFWCNNFSSNSIIESVTLPEGIESIGSKAFRKCTNLKSVTLPSTMKSIPESAFEECPSLTTVNIPSGVTEIGNYAFKNCTSLTSITIPDTVVSIGEGAFSGCTSLKEVNILGNIESVGAKCFENCTNLTTVNFLSVPAEFGDNVFSGCDSINSITATNGFGTASITPFKDTKWFASLQQQDGLIIMDGVVVSGINASGAVTIPDGITAIADYAFADCSQVTSISIPDSVTYNGKRAFSKCGITAIIK